MKTNILPSVAYLATIAAFILLPVSAVAASIGLSITGTLSILAADYGRRIEPLEPPAAATAASLPHQALTEYRIAA